MYKVSFMMVLLVVLGVSLGACGKRADVKPPVDYVEPQNAY